MEISHPVPPKLQNQTRQSMPMSGTRYLCHFQKELEVKVKQISLEHPADFQVNVGYCIY